MEKLLNQPLCNKQHCNGLNHFDPYRSLDPVNVNRFPFLGDDNPALFMQINSHIAHRFHLVSPFLRK